MRNDPIIAELRTMREAHAAQFNYDFDQISADLRTKQERARLAGRVFVTLPSKPVADWERSSCGMTDDTSPSERIKNAEHLTRNDPVMQELWAAKAAINKEANYSVSELVRRLHEKYPTGNMGTNTETVPDPKEKPAK
jgi:hypothetical protein